MQAMTKTLKMSFYGRSPTSNTWPGNQVTRFMPRTYKIYGIYGIDPTGLHSDQMLSPSRTKSRKTFLDLQSWICLTARQKAIEFAEFYTVTKNGDSTWMKCGDWMSWASKVERKFLSLVLILTTSGLNTVFNTKKHQ